MHRYAGIALNGRTASVLVYGVNRSGRTFELAALELPVLGLSRGVSRGGRDEFALNQ